ncbi:DNA methylase N-4 [Vulcanibacillus modesticaldus]|uniref:Methyltransferase n=1 Tax=Vulcanibacillus modesticaldus TaxID=337097 RepID=A0A1D2YTX2_9BACI|nr:DNA methyltransferase [Vulcanibacillus modesticaldus]OEF99126.1 DNA methylase N-4 [Vulcanibacillus modesticaldus]
MTKKIKCIYCSEKLYKKEYIYHLETEHTYQYEELINRIVELNNEGYTIKEIEEYVNLPEKHIYNKLEILREEKEKYNVKKPLKITNWEPKDFELEATTVWSFPDRGKWATHSGKYRGNWSPYIPRNVILRYSQKNDVVLDQFLGSGTTLIEAKLLERKGIGVDINPDAIKIAKENLRFKKNYEYEPTIYNADARNLNLIKDNSIDLICTHPPYANIIKYSEGIKDDLSHFDIDEFIEEMGKVAKESYRVLKEGKYCAILIGDTRRNKHMVPLGFKVMQEFLNAGFLLKETIIKEQHNCKATGLWYRRSIEYNFLLIAHEYLFVFRKPEE